MNLNIVITILNQVVHYYEGRFYCIQMLWFLFRFLWSQWSWSGVWVIWIKLEVCFRSQWHDIQIFLRYTLSDITCCIFCLALTHTHTHTHTHMWGHTHTQTHTWGHTHTCAHTHTHTHTQCSLYAAYSLNNSLSVQSSSCGWWKDR